MAATRSTKYASRSDADGIEELSKKLTADLRKNIRALGPCSVLSERWCEMADCLARVANISRMEKEIPKEDDATLWECEELALRYVLEDGKLNLCLRLLEEYLALAKEVDNGARDVTPEQREKMDTFEQGIGQLLANAWLHVEALQTTDIPLLVTLMEHVLRKAVADTETEPYQYRQPAMVVHYIYAIAKNLDEVGETRVFGELMSHDIIPLFITHCAKNHGRMTPKDHEVAALGLSALAAAEDFGTNKARILSSEEVMADLVSLEGAFVSGMTGDADGRRKLRPLLDLLAATKRSASK